MTAERDANLAAAVAAIGQGQLTQISLFGEEIKRLSDEIEKVSGRRTGRVHAASIEEVEVIASDAKTHDIKDGLQVLQERFNALLASLREAKVIGES